MSGLLCFLTSSSSLSSVFCSSGGARRGPHELRTFLPSHVFTKQLNQGNTLADHAAADELLAVGA
jgi:hypothetical protein